jgi:hypothetical protein
MGLNNEYSYDIVQDDAYDPQEIEDPDDRELVLDPQSWQDWHSEHLLNMWMGLRAYLEDNHLTNIMMTHMTFHDFCTFVQKQSI